MPVPVVSSMATSIPVLTGSFRSLVRMKTPELQPLESL